MSNHQTQITQTFHEAHSRVLASLISTFKDFELAEDVLQDAFVSALEHWQTDGIPSNPAAWLLTTARHKAIDRLRRNKKWIDEGGQENLERLPHPDQPNTDVDENIFPDERLKLIFTCCHPALAEEAQIALALRTLGGLTTEEIAHAFFVPAATMAQRLVRAQRKIRDAGIPYEVPATHKLGERMAAVLGTIYLIFNEGYDAAFGAALMRQDLCYEAIRLCSLLLQLVEGEPKHATLQLFRPELMGLLALMLLHDARRNTRTNAAGQIVLLEDQDRALWDREQIARGQHLLERALLLHRPGPYQIQAAISAVHAEAARSADTDWPQIAALYEALTQYLPTPVVQLNRAVAVSFADGPLAGLMLLDQLKLDQDLGQYHFYHATRADLLRRLGMRDEAAVEYQRALDLCQNKAEQQFLLNRIEAL